jgi:hypothetical protein
MDIYDLLGSDIDATCSAADVVSVRGSYGDCRRFGIVGHLVDLLDQFKELKDVIRKK